MSSPNLDHDLGTIEPLPAATIHADEQERRGQTNGSAVPRCDDSAVGTRRGAARHKARGEQPCDACREARNAYDRERWRRTHGTPIEELAYTGGWRLERGVWKPIGERLIDA